MLMHVTLRYMLALGQPLVVLLIGIALGALVLDDDANVVDQIYFAFISMSTIGYGLDLIARPRCRSP